MRTIWIIGGGKFGLKAAGVLGAKHPKAGMTIVEQDRHTCRRLETQPFQIVCADGIRYLDQNLKKSDGPDLIIPAVPIHLAYEWIKRKLLTQFYLSPLAVPRQLSKMLPNAITGDCGQVYMSNADFICPENCSEPEEVCTVTGKPRPRILYQFLTKIHFEDFQPVVVCSRQLAPGVGGFTPRDLWAALGRIKSLQGRIALATACRCHGVMHAFKIQQMNRGCNVS